MQNETKLEIVDRLRRSKKYGSLCDDSLYRIVTWAAVRHRKPAEVLDAARRKLHQVHGAYFERFRFAEIERLIANLSPQSSDQELRNICWRILEHHTSTAERLSIMEELYTVLFRDIGRPGTVVDLACGLHPFALPWMALERDTKYHAFDIDHRLISLINSFFGRLGRPQTAECRDVLVSVPDVEADVAFLLKSVPCLEQQEKGVSTALLRRLKARNVVVSFPTGTLGGRDKGMRRHYGKLIRTIVEDLGVPVQCIEYDNEVFYVLRSAPPR